MRVHPRDAAHKPEAKHEPSIVYGGTPPTHTGLPGQEMTVRW